MLSPQNTANCTTLGTQEIMGRPALASIPLPVFQKAARGVGVVGIQGLAFAINVPDHSLLVDDKGGAMRHGKFLVQDSVLGCGLAGEITKQGKGHAQLVGVSLVGESAVNTDSQNYGAGLLKFGDISLIRLKLFGSTTGEGQNVKRQHHIFLSLELAERDLVAILIGQAKVRRLVTHFQGCGLRRQRACQRQRGHTRHHAKPSLHGGTSW